MLRKFTFTSFFAVIGLSSLFSQTLNFSDAVISCAEGNNRLIQKAVQMLQDEVEKRTAIALPLNDFSGAENNPSIVIGLEKDLSMLSHEYKQCFKMLPATAKDGYKVAITRDNKTILIAGNDERGVIYGVGYLLRKMELKNNEIMVPNFLSLSSSPKFPIRGHQFSYILNHKSTIQEKEIYEQYLRELMYFGLNHISVSSPEEAELCIEYGLEVSIWMPNVRGDFESPEGIQRELDKRENIFRRMPKLDEILVPSGDPGDLEPDVLFNWLEKLAPVLMKYHPNAKIWVSAQNNNKGKATPEWYEMFYERVNRNYPWLGGMIFGPWTRTSLEEMREIVNENIPIRRYPDITHLFGCQYPAPELDLVFPHTLGRMSIQPRPENIKHIHNLYADLVIGARPYSEGNSDDVNKFVWSDQDWNPETPVLGTLLDYGRLFIGPDYAHDFALGVLGLEKNLKSPLLTNSSVETTLMQWQAMEKAANNKVLQNPRFQLGLVRAYYDAYQKQRLTYEIALENKALEVLRGAEDRGALHAIDSAGDILMRATNEPICQDYKEKISILYHSLFRASGLQWMTEIQECLFFERIDAPLNSSEWLIAQFDTIRSANTDAERLQLIDDLLNRTNPGSGGFYDNLGTESSFKRVKSRKTAHEDPGSHVFPRRNYIRGSIPMPVSWKLQMASLYDEPLVLVYDNLDPNSNYNIRINYTGAVGRGQSKMKLVANEKYIIHDFINTEGKPIQEFPIPEGALQDGEIEFTWTCGKGERASVVAEVWIIKQK